MQQSGEPAVIGWVGAGRLGEPMAARIMMRSHPLLLCEPREEACRQLAEAGAQVVVSAADCVAQAGYVFSSLPNDTALAEGALGDDGVLARPRAGLVFVDTSTVSPAVSARVAERASASGVAYLRMPVSGNPSFAREGRLRAFVSGSEETWLNAKSIVEAFTSAQRYVGGGEQARYMRLVVNLLVANAALVMAEALVLGRAGGLDWETMLDALADRPLSSPWLANKLDVQRRRDFSPTFPPWMMLKDIDLMLDAARDCGIPLTMTAVTRQVMQALTAEDFADEDFFLAIKMLERQSGLSPV